MTYPPARLPGDVDVVVVGGGQAGLAVSWHLRHLGVEHVVLERDRIAGTWRKHRWDTFCLVTPNWQCRLPEFAYRGDDPDGFMVRDQIIDYVESFAASFDPPVHEGVAVRRIASADGSGFVVETSHGELRAKQVVLCVGGYPEARLPEVGEQLPSHVTQLHSSGYRNPSSLPSGATLVVGSGQSGAQIAEDLLLAGRQVHLSVGSAPRVARFYRGRDCVAWLEDIGHYDMPVDEHPEGPVAARHEPNHYVTGRGGGHDIDLRAHARPGCSCTGGWRGSRTVGCSSRATCARSSTPQTPPRSASRTRSTAGSTSRGSTHRPRSATGRLGAVQRYRDRAGPEPRRRELGRVGDGLCQ